MRTYLMLGTAAFTLAACGGGSGPETAGSVAPPVVNGETHSFVKPTVAKTYEAVGAVQHLEYETRSDRIGQTGQLYAGDANTPRDGGLTITYDPRDAIFDIVITRAKAVVTNTLRFQDPLHRTAFGGTSEPQAGVPPTAAEKNIQYLESGTSTGSATRYATDLPLGAPGFQYSVNTFFYQKPGTTTKYVTYGGFVQNTLSTTSVTEQVYDANGEKVLDADGKAVTRTYLRNTYDLDRAVFAWGERTDNGAVPRSGTGTFTGDMLGVMVFNDKPDVDLTSPNYFQWITGTNQTIVDFGARSVRTTLTGTVSNPAFDSYTSRDYTIAAGSLFTATGTATIDLVNRGGFSGNFSDARFQAPNGGATSIVTIGGSSIDGTFFGPAAEEIGAGFRIVGGTPDQRIDITGAFTGKK
jgi:hypothetical protein